MVENLIGWGANVNAVDMLNRTALYLAVKHGSMKLVNLLVGKGADASIAAVSGVSPEQMAKEGSPLWIVLNKHDYQSP